MSKVTKINSKIMKDKRGAYRTRTLFKELNNKKDYTPLFTMCSEDKDGLKSARKIYVSCNSENEAANKILGSVEHWNKLLKCDDFINGIESCGWEGLNEWRKERIERMKATMTTVLISEAAEGNVSAAKTVHANAEKEMAALFPKAKGVAETPEDDDDDATFKLLKGFKK